MHHRSVGRRGSGTTDRSGGGAQTPQTGRREGIRHHRPVGRRGSDTTDRSGGGDQAPQIGREEGLRHHRPVGRRGAGNGRVMTGDGVYVTDSLSHAVANTVGGCVAADGGARMTHGVAGRQRSDSARRAR